MLVELTAKYPKCDKVPDYDLEAVSYQTDGNEVFEVKEIKPYEKIEALEYFRYRVRKDLNKELLKNTDGFEYTDRCDPRYL
tara:strand:+ start:1690 stop:1932 length:243 start_codon:yes stop_codon:yes gene_type:complete